MGKALNGGSDGLCEEFIDGASDGLHEGNSDGNSDGDPVIGESDGRCERRVVVGRSRM